MRAGVAKLLALCFAALCVRFSGAWTACGSQAAANVAPRPFPAHSAWKVRLPSRQRAVSETTMQRQRPRTSQSCVALLDAATDTTLPQPLQPVQPLQPLRVDLPSASTVDAGNDADASEPDYDWVLTDVLERLRMNPEITQEDVRLAYECFYNVSVARADEGVQILLAHTGLFLSKNVTELYMRCLEVAPEDHVANLSAGLTVVVSYVESFAESWGRMLDRYRTLLRGAVNATTASAEALDNYIQEHKANLTSPGFGRFLQGEIESAPDEQVRNFLRFLQVRIIGEQEAGYPEELQVVSRLLSLTDAAQRQSELEYFIRAAPDPHERAQRVMAVLDSALQEANGMELMTAAGLEATALLKQLMQIAKSVAQSLEGRANW